MKIIKVGLDVHGVITKDPNLFALLSNRLITRGHEVHIITGQELCDALLNEIKDYNISYTKIFSITSYHKEIGTYVSYKDDDKTQPLIAPPKWDKTKAYYCHKHGLNFHIDDSVIYGKYFKNIGTQYLLYTPELRELLFNIQKIDSH